MMIFNSYIAVNDFNFGTQIMDWPSRFLSNKIKLCEGICLALVGTFHQKKLWILSLFKTVLGKTHLIYFCAYLWTCQLNKVIRDLICICKQKMFFNSFIDTFRLNWELKASPVNLPNQILSLFSCMCWEQLPCLFFKFLCLLRYQTEKPFCS